MPFTDEDAAWELLELAGVDCGWEELFTTTVLNEADPEFAGPKTMTSIGSPAAICH
jgi:hypothetical protein